MNYARRSALLCQLLAAGVPLEILTPAERLVAVHVAQGLSNKEISSALSKAEPTVKHQLQSAMRALGVQSRCQLIVLLLSEVPRNATGYATFAPVQTTKTKGPRDSVRAK